MTTKSESYYENTLLGKLEVRWILFRVKWRHEKPEAFWRWLAYKLPRSLVCWALVRAAVNAVDWNGNVTDPSKLTYPQMFDRWTEGA